MNVTKQQIVNGLVRYAKNEIIEKISDKPLKIIIATAVSMAEAKPEIVNSIFENPIISSILDEKDGMYNLDTIGSALENAMREYGDFPINIPAIKFISPAEKQLTFNIEDINKLKQYVSGGIA